MNWYGSLLSLPSPFKEISPHAPANSGLNKKKGGREKTEKDKAAEEQSTELGITLS